MKATNGKKVKPPRTRHGGPGAAKPTKEGLRVRGRFWVSAGGETFLGYGRVVLLERIQEHGSITQAAKSMGMAYRHAWELVDSMNRHSRKPLVVSAVGGQQGGGTTVTDEGLKAISFFWKTYDAFQKGLARLQPRVDELGGD